MLVCVMSIFNTSWHGTIHIKHQDELNNICYFVTVDETQSLNLGVRLFSLSFFFFISFTLQDAINTIHRNIVVVKQCCSSQILKFLHGSRS